MQTSRYLDYDCVTLQNEHLSLLVTQSVGPRILSLSVPGGENLLATLPDAATTRPDGKVYRFYGGHRLWHSPEHMPRTYDLDNDPVEIVPVPGGLKVTQATEPLTGIQKSMQIVLAPDRARLTIDHQLTNQGLWAVECAPWAITQLRPGGTAILPFNQEDTGLLPNRSLAMWPYNDMTSPNLHWGRSGLRLKAEMPSAFKVGFANPRGWLAYWLDDCLFVKHAKFEADRAYYDFGSSSECYCNAQFIELETLGPIVNIQPGQTVSHVETWEVFRDVAEPKSELDVKGLAARFRLE